MSRGLRRACASLLALLLVAPAPARGVTRVSLAGARGTGNGVAAAPSFSAPPGAARLSGRPIAAFSASRTRLLPARGARAPAPLSAAARGALPVWAASAGGRGSAEESHAEPPGAESRPVPALGQLQGALSDWLETRPEAAVGGFDPVIKDGVAFVQFAYDAGLAIDLDAAQRGLDAMTARSPIRHQKRAPKAFEFQPYPLRVTQSAPVQRVGGWQTLPSVEAVLYDFGAISLTYQIPLAGPLSSLAKLSELLYDNQALLADSRRLAKKLLNGIQSAISRPLLSEFYEDYVVFQVREFAEPGARARLLQERPTLLAQVLRADGDLRSEQEVKDALSSQVSYADDDLALMDWVSALLFDKDGEDTRAVLEYATVQLLEQRQLDQQLDGALERYYKELSKSPRGLRLLFTKKADRALREIGELQVESALLFEGVNNAIKLFGDQYLARLYQQAVRRHQLASWDASIQRKLDTLGSIYDKMEHALSSARIELLEWIVIILIAIEVVMPFIDPLIDHFARLF